MTYELLSLIASYSFVTAPCVSILVFLLPNASFIINVPSVYKVVTESTNLTVHVVSFVTLFIVNILLFIVPFWLFVQVTESPFIVPFCTITFTLYLFVSHIAYKSI